MGEPEKLVAAISRWSETVWLYRVTKETAQRLYVEIVHTHKNHVSPAHGRADAQYLHREQAITVRDMEHFAAICEARKEFQQAIAGIEATANDRKRKARERYEAAIA